MFLSLQMGDVYNYFAVFIVILSLILIWLIYAYHEDAPETTPTTNLSLVMYVAILFSSILVWRGLWVLMDLYFFPHCAVVSAVLCIVIGLVIIGAIVNMAPRAILTMEA